MNEAYESDATVYKVVVSEEDQYSIWPAYKENARGWRDTGMQGSEPECLAFIKQSWSDMRPKSLQQMMA